MPFIFNFDEGLTPIKTVNINPKGWKNPITIEYCSAQARIYDTMISVCWRVKGTTHTFTIYENQLNKLSHGNYANHFTEVLELFREDYKTWFEDEEYQGCDWRNDYQLQYGNLIL